MDGQTETKPETKTPAPEWALVEIMGHRTHAGMIVEVSRFGTALMEVREYGTEDAEPYRTHQYGGSSIFSITPCTEEYARKTCDEKWRWSREGKAAPKLAWRGDDTDDEDMDAYDNQDRYENAE